MNKPDNIETKIENLCSAMEAGDHKAFAEIISSEDNWKKAEDQLGDCGFMYQFINGCCLIFCEKYKLPSSLHYAVTRRRSLARNLLANQRTSGFITLRRGVMK